MARPPEDKQTAYARILDFENTMCRRFGRSRMERYSLNFGYYSGENLLSEDIEQPLAINYVKSLNEKHNHYLWGLWEGNVVSWRVKPLDDSDEAKARAKVITDHVCALARQNELDGILVEAGLNASIFGDAVLSVAWDDVEGRVRITTLLPEYVHFRWGPTDLNDVREVIVAYPVARADAEEEYGTPGNPDWLGKGMPGFVYGVAIYWERWTSLERERYLDDVPLEAQEPNPYVAVRVDSTGAPAVVPGIVPFIHVPNVRAGGEFYGQADAEGVFGLQDEINRKLADQGDIIGNFAHPTVILNKFYGNKDDLPVGPDVVWDLGRDGEAKILQWEGTPPAVMEYVDRLVTIMLDLAAISPVAYGRHKGTQQSAIALAIEMMPTTERARWKRLFWTSALRRLMRTAILIEERMGAELPFSYAELLEHDLEIVWAPMLPRDRAQEVNENINRAVNRLRSIETALADLGEQDPSGERARIMQDVRELVELGAKIQGINLQGTGQGSSSLPEGASKATGRPAGLNKVD